MAGRGRGRGKSVSFDIQALGFGRGEALPAASLQPPPLFPTQEFKPVPLLQNEDFEYMLALKQEFVATLRKSQYYIKESEKKADIERYSDKYQLSQHEGAGTFEPDWRRLPDELRIKEKKKRKVKSNIVPNIPTKQKKAVEMKEKGKEELLQTLETLEKKEGSGDVEEEEEKEEKEGGEEGEEEEEFYDEDDLEEETDYASNYFDNGEGYGDDDGTEDEGPIY